MVQAITVPHTRKGVLPAGSAVRVEGTAMPTYLAGNDTNLSDSRLEVFMVQSSSGAEISLGTSGEHDFSTSTPLGSSSPVGHIVIEPVTEGHVWHWKIDINPLVFLKAFYGSPGSEQYTFGARLVNPAGKPSDDACKDQLVDMTPTDPGIIGADWQTVSGRAVMKGTETVDANAEVTVTWPSNRAGNTSDTVMSGADGAWAVLLPSGIESGEVNVTVVDSNGNQSEPYKQYLDVAPPLHVLPLAGAPKTYDAAPGVLPCSARRLDLRMAAAQARIHSACILNRWGYRTVDASGNCLCRQVRMRHQRAPFLDWLS